MFGYSSQTFSRINTPTFLKPSYSSYLPPYEDGTECSETSACKIQTPRNYPEESIQHSEQGESLESMISVLFEGLTGMFFTSRLTASSVRDLATLRSLTSADRNKSPWCGRNEVSFTAVRLKTRARTVLRCGSRHGRCSGM